MKCVANKISKEVLKCDVYAIYNDKAISCHGYMHFTSSRSRLLFYAEVKLSKDHTNILFLLLVDTSD